LKRSAPAVLSTLLSLSTLLGIATAAHADPSQPPAAPTNLSMVNQTTGKALDAGGWTNRNRVELRFQVQVASGPVTPQVEVEPADTPFTGKPTATGALLSSSGTAVVAVGGLVDRQTYHWQARTLVPGGAASTWVGFNAQNTTGPDFGVDQDPPSRPDMTSSTDPDQNRWYNTQVPLVQWKSRDDLSGIAGYTYQLERQAHVIPPGPTVTGTTAKLTNLTDGTWILAVRAEDRAGNWSPTATFRLQLDRRAPHLVWLSPQRFTFNPFQGPTTVRFRSDKDASVQLTLYRVGADRPIRTFDLPGIRAGQTVSLTWNGKNRHGKTVRRGYYFFSVVAVDRANNIARLNLGGIVVQPSRAVRSVSGQLLYPGDGKRIIVSLSRQALYAYDGTRLDMTTLVTTGNPALPTPLGSYTVMAKYHPFQFVSPWPPGSPFYYPPSWTSYAMLFRDGGYFLHDAPWRSNFGPGSNAQLGTPGGSYTGTHGCVNIPIGPMTFLWNWTPIGTTVDIVP